MAYEFVDHTADVKVNVTAKNLTEGFTESANATLETMYEGTQIDSKKNREISVVGTDLKSLLYNFLEEFVFLLDSEGFVCSDVTDLIIDENKFTLSAVLYGDDRQGYNFSNSVKAPTYNDMEISSTDSSCNITFVLDV